MRDESDFYLVDPGPLYKVVWPSPSFRPRCVNSPWEGDSWSAFTRAGKEADQTGNFSLISLPSFCGLPLSTARLLLALPFTMLLFRLSLLIRNYCPPRIYHAPHSGAATEFPLSDAQLKGTRWTSVTNGICNGGGCALRNYFQIEFRWRHTPGPSHLTSYGGLVLVSTQSLARLSSRRLRKPFKFDHAHRSLSPETFRLRRSRFPIQSYAIRKRALMNLSTWLSVSKITD